MSFEIESLRTLHIVLAAAFVGYLAFCVSHAWGCWSKRQQAGGAGRRLPWLAIGVLGLVLVAAGWMDDHQLVRREGVIAGDSFQVVRARDNATTTDLVAAGEVRSGQVIATFRGPAISQQLKSTEAEVSSLSAELASAELAAPEPDSSLSMARADARSEWQSLASGMGSLSFAGQDSSAALRAQAEEAEARLARMTALRADGVVTVQDVDSARSRAVTAREALRLSERGQTLAKAAEQRMARLDADIVQDRQRAVARRSAQVRALADKLQDARAKLAALHQQFEIRAPYDGRIVFRNAAPDLVKAGDPVLALAKGAGFRARVQIPAHEAALLHAGQPLRLSLKQALVETAIVGRFAGAARSAQGGSDAGAAEDADKAVIEILCDLPVEQFAQMAQGGVAVRLDWAPPLHANRVAQLGFAAVVLALLLWSLERLRRVRPAGLRPVQTAAAETAAAKTAAAKTVVTPRPVAASALATQMHQLGVRLREEVGDGHVLRETVTAIEWMMDRHPLLASRPLREGFHEGAAPWSPANVLSHHDESMRERLRRLLNLVAERVDMRTGASHAAAA